MGRPRVVRYRVVVRGKRVCLAIRPPGARGALYPPVGDCTEAAALRVGSPRCEAAWREWLSAWRAAGADVPAAWLGVLARPVGFRPAAGPPVVAFGIPLAAPAPTGPAPITAGPYLPQLSPRAQPAPPPWARPDGVADDDLPPWAGGERRIAGFTGARLVAPLLAEFEAALQAGWYKATANSHAVSFTTAHTMMQHVRALAAHCQWRSLTDVSAASLAEFHERARQRQVLTRQTHRPIAVASLYAYYRSLDAFGRWLYSRGLLARPLTVPFVKADWRPREVRITEGDTLKLIAARPRWHVASQQKRFGLAQAVPVRLGLMILLETGLRGIHLARAMVGDFDRPANDLPALSLPGLVTKNGDPLQFVLSPAVAAELAAVLAERPYAPTERPWGHVNCHGIVTPRVQRATWARWWRAIGAPADAHGRYGLHCIRHAGALGRINRTRASGAHDLGLGDLAKAPTGWRQLKTAVGYMGQLSRARAARQLPGSPLASHRGGAWTVTAEGCLDLVIERAPGDYARAHLCIDSPVWSRFQEFVRYEIGALAVPPAAAPPPELPPPPNNPL